MQLKKYIWKIFSTIWHYILDHPWDWGRYLPYLPVYLQLSVAHIYCQGTSWTFHSTPPNPVFVKKELFNLRQIEGCEARLERIAWESFAPNERSVIKPSKMIRNGARHLPLSSKNNSRGLWISSPEVGRKTIDQSATILHPKHLVCSRCGEARDPQVRPNYLMPRIKIYLKPNSMLRQFPWRQKNCKKLGEWAWIKNSQHRNGLQNHVFVCSTWRRKLMIHRCKQAESLPATILIVEPEGAAIMQDHSHITIYQTYVTNAIISPGSCDDH